MKSKYEETAENKMSEEIMNTIERSFYWGRGQCTLNYQETAEDQIIRTKLEQNQILFVFKIY